MNKNGKMDKLDMNIISRLMKNCRESNRQVSQELGLSGGAVCKRIQKMKASNIIEKFFVKIEPTALNYDMLIVVVPGHNMKEIMEHVSLVGEPYFIIPCIYNVTICSIVIKEDIKKKVTLVTKLLKDCRILFVYKAKKHQINLTKTDLKILKELLEDPRQKIEEIAKNIKLSTKTISRCIEKFGKNKEFQFTLIYNPINMKKYITYMILVKVKGNTRQTLNNLDKLFAKSYLQMPIVTRKQILMFMYNSNIIFEVDNQLNEIKNMNNVESIDLFIPKKIICHNDWLEKFVNNSKHMTKLHLIHENI